MLKRSYRESCLTTAEPLRRRPESRRCECTLNQRKMGSWLDLLHPNLQGKVRGSRPQGTREKIYPGRESVCQELWAKIWTIIHVTGPVSYAVALQDRRECRRHVDHLRSRRTDSDSMIPVCQRKQVDTDTEITPQNAYKPFGSVLPNRETAIVASIPDALMSSVTPEAIEVERDNVMTEIRDIPVFTPTPTLPRVTTPARKTGTSRLASACQVDYVMD